MGYWELILLTAILFRAESSKSVYKDLLRTFDVQPLGEGNDEELSQESGRYYNDGQDCAYPRDCQEVLECGRTRSGVYRVFPYGLGVGLLVSCDMDVRGGGWLVFQRRRDGSVDFYRNWQNYTDGFGNLHGEFWLGLEKIHLFTSQRDYKLLVVLGSYNNGTRYAEYDKFFVSDAPESFQLLLGLYSGNAGDSLSYHNGFKFSTYDRQNDHHIKKNCAKSYSGAWWYKSCHYSHLNGLYFDVTRNSQDSSSSMSWWHWTSSYKPLQFTEMLLRPVSAN